MIILDTHPLDTGSYQLSDWSIEPVRPLIQLLSGPFDKEDYRFTLKETKDWYTALQGQQQ